MEERTKPPRKPRARAKTAPTGTTGPKSAAGKRSAGSTRKAGPTAGVEREAMVRTAAYFRAERRGFAPGHEWEDWLAAEAEVGTRSPQPRSARPRKPKAG